MYSCELSAAHSISVTESPGSRRISPVSVPTTQTSSATDGPGSDEPQPDAERDPLAVRRPDRAWLLPQPVERDHLGGGDFAVRGEVADDQGTTFLRPLLPVAPLSGSESRAVGGESGAHLTAGLAVGLRGPDAERNLRLTK